MNGLFIELLPIFVYIRSVVVLKNLDQLWTIGRITCVNLNSVKLEAAIASGLSKKDAIEIFVKQIEDELYNCKVISSVHVDLIRLCFGRPALADC